MNKEKVLLKNSKRFILLGIVLFFYNTIFCEQNINVDLAKKQQVISDLKSPSAKVRLDAIQYLLNNQSEETIDILVEHLKAEKDAYLKSQIIEGLNVRVSTVALNVVISATEDSNPYIRQLALINLANYDKLEDISGVIKKVLKKDNNLYVKMTALNTLRRHSSTTTVELIDIVLSNPKEDKKLRLLSVNIMGNMNTPQAKSKLKKYRNDLDVEVGNAVNKYLSKTKK